MQKTLPDHINAKNPCGGFGMYGRLLFARHFSVSATGYLHVCIRPFSEA
jgi:hypothetical protein